MQPPAGQPIPAAAAPPSPADQLNVPSIIVLSAAALGVMEQLYNAVAASAADPQVAEKLNDPALPAGFKSLMLLLLGSQRPISIVGLLLCGLCIYGAIQMRQLKMWGLSVAASILVMVPCATCCCCFPGLVGGIWALVVLMKPEVKSAFS